MILRYKLLYNTKEISKKVNIKTNVYFLIFSLKIHVDKRTVKKGKIAFLEVILINKFSLLLDWLR